MLFKPTLKAEYIISSPNVSGCPRPDKPEYAFLGRSNVGKSSLINMVTGLRSLARTSGTPGKTRLINHFLIDEQWYLVDLPGFGFAKTSKKNRTEWDQMIRSYLLARENLMCNFLLVDARHDLQDIDHQLITFHGEERLPFAIVFTKTDKLSPPALQRNIAHYKKSLIGEWEELPPLFLTSAETGTGRQELLEFIYKTNELFGK
jgi:GTP-binding protein